MCGNNHSWTHKEKNCDKLKRIDYYKSDTCSIRQLLLDRKDWYNELEAAFIIQVYIPTLAKYMVSAKTLTEKKMIVNIALIVLMLQRET